MRFLSLALCQLLLWGLASAANFFIAPWHVALVLCGLHVAWAALMLPPGVAFSSAFFAGLLFDAASPTPFGTHAWLLGGASIAIHVARQRLAREEPGVQAGVALLVNFAVFVALSALNLHGNPSPWALMLRASWDFLWSSVAMAILTPWFGALQERALVLASPSFLRRREESM